MKRIAVAALAAATIGLVGCEATFVAPAKSAHHLLKHEYLPLLRGDVTPQDLVPNGDTLANVIRQREAAVAALGDAIKEAE